MTHRFTSRRHPSAALAIVATLIVTAAHAQPRPPDEVVVTSSRIATPLRQVATAVSILDGAELTLRGYETLADALRTQPGVAVTNAGGIGRNTVVRVRGEEHFRTLLMIDGVKVVDPSAPQVAPSFDQLLATDDIERIEILRGPQGFLYGADAGGVVNVLTPRGSGGPLGRFTLESGAYGTRKLAGSVAGGSDTIDYYVSATDLETDGFNSQTLDTSGERDGANNTTTHAKLGWNASEQLRFEVVARDVAGAADFDDCFRPVTFAPTNTCAVTANQTHYKLSADYRPGRLTHNVGYSGVDMERDNFADGALAYGSRGEIERLEYLGSFAATPATMLVYGTDLQAESLRGTENVERDQAGYFVEYQGTFAAKYFVTAGARYDDNDAFGSHTSARVGAAYAHDLDGDGILKLRTTFGTGFRAPSLYEIDYNRGPFAYPPASLVDLAEESSRGYDLGIDYDRGTLHLEATYFKQRIRDELYFDLQGFSGYLQSTGTSRSEGVELGAKASVGTRFELSANVTRNSTRDTTNQQRLRRPKFFGNVGVAFAPAGERLRVLANYRLARDAVDVGPVALDDYEVIDVSLDYSVREQLAIFARVENAGDERYEEAAGYNTAGRSAYAGVRIRLR